VPDHPNHPTLFGERSEIVDHLLDQRLEIDRSLWSSTWFSREYWSTSSIIRPIW